MYICSVYNPPSNSSVLNTRDVDLFEIIERDTEKYDNKGELFRSFVKRSIHRYC